MSSKDKEKVDVRNAGFSSDKKEYMESIRAF
jgi:hypothetical protein